MLNSCKMVEKQSEAFHTFLWHFLKHNFIAYRSSKVHIAFLKFTSCDNQVLIGCIPIAAVAVLLKIGRSSHKMYSNNIVNFQESTTILNACTKSLETYWKHHVYIYIYIYGSVCVFMDGGPRRRFYLRHLWSGAGLFWRTFFFYFGTKTIQRAVPAKTCVTEKEDEGLYSVRSRGSVS